MDTDKSDARTAGAGTVRVSLATPADWSSMRALRLAALAEAPDAFSATLAEERDQPDAFWRARMERPEARTLRAQVRCDEGPWRDAGLAVLAPSFDDPSVTGLYSVWVAPEARGLGVGAALVSKALELARSEGARRVVLDVGEENVRARRLYERAGFRATGRVFARTPPREHILENELAVELASARDGEAPAA